MGIFSLHSLSKKEISNIGYKAGYLGELSSSFNVPHGFVISATMFQKFLDETGLAPKVEQILKDINPAKYDQLQSWANKIQKLIVSTEIPDSIKKDILEFYHSLDVDKKQSQNLEPDEKHKSEELIESSSDVFVAVRSSPTIIAGSKAHINFHNVIGEEKLLRAVKMCWASLFTAKATHNYVSQEIYDAKMPVLVQKMLVPNVSGRVLTVSQKSPGELVIEACYGLGDALTSGMILPDRYLVNKKTNDVQKYEVNRQAVKLICDPDLEKTIKLEVGHENAERQKLEDQYIQEVSSVAKRIEKHLGAAQKIDFAYEDDKLFVLESIDIPKQLLPIGRAEDLIEESSSEEFSGEIQKEVTEEKENVSDEDELMAGINKSSESIMEETQSERILEDEKTEEPLVEEKEITSGEGHLPVVEETEIPSENEHPPVVEEFNEESHEEPLVSEEKEETEDKGETEEEMKETEEVPEEIESPEVLHEEVSEPESVEASEPALEKVDYPNFEPELSTEEENILNNLPSDEDDETVLVEMEEHENKQEEINEMIDAVEEKTEEISYNEGDHDEVMGQLETIGQEDSQDDSKEELNHELEENIAEHHPPEKSEHSEIYEEPNAYEEPLHHQHEVNDEVEQAIEEQKEGVVEEEAVDENDEGPSHQDEDHIEYGEPEEPNEPVEEPTIETPSEETTEEPAQIEGVNSPLNPFYEDEYKKPGSYGSEVNEDHVQEPVPHDTPEKPFEMDLEPEEKVEYETEPEEKEPDEIIVEDIHDSVIEHVHEHQEPEKPFEMDLEPEQKAEYETDSDTHNEETEEKQEESDDEKKDEEIQW